MTADVPRRLPRTQGQRVQNVVRTHAAQSLGGATAAARPVQNTTPTPTIYKPPSTGGGNVVTGTGDADSVSITSTVAGAGSSDASGVDSVAIGPNGVTATAQGAVAIGDGTSATSAGAVAVGTSSATAPSAVAIGATASASAQFATAVGHGAEADGLLSTVIGNGYAGGAYATAVGAASAVADGSVAIGTDSGGLGAEADNANEFMLGTANHHVIVKGGLILADSSGGLHRLVVSTGGALSTVAYP